MSAKLTHRAGEQWAPWNRPVATRPVPVVTGSGKRHRDAVAAMHAAAAKARS